MYFNGFLWKLLKLLESGISNSGKQGLFLDKSVMVIATIMKESYDFTLLTQGEMLFDIDLSFLFLLLVTVTGSVILIAFNIYLQLFPYHLAEHVCRVMRISPFRYYCDMIFEVMRNGILLLHFIAHFSLKVLLASEFFILIPFFI